MIKLINLLDIFVNVFILVLIHVIFCKIERNNSNKKGLICLKYLARILHYPLILYFSIYIISHKDNMLILYLGADILYYIIKIMCKYGQNITYLLHGALNSYIQQKKKKKNNCRKIQLPFAVLTPKYIKTILHPISFSIRQCRHLINIILYYFSK